MGRGAEVSGLAKGGGLGVIDFAAMALIPMMGARYTTSQVLALLRKANTYHLTPNAASMPNSPFRRATPEAHPS